MRKEDFNILIADDDPSVRDLVADFLSSEGYTVDTAADGEEAVEKVLYSSYPLVIADIRMPGASGLQVLEKVLSRDPDASVILITAYATLDSAIKAVEDGAYDYVMKPFRMDELAVTVGNAFLKAGLLEENRYLLSKIRNDNGGDPLERLERLSRLRTNGVVTEDEFTALKEKVIDGIHAKPAGPGC